MATKERRTSQLPIVGIVNGTDKVIVLKSGVTSLADVNLVTAAAFSGKTTDLLSEGAQNQYFTTEKVRTKVSQMLQAGTGVSLVANEANQTITINSLGEVRSVNGLTGFVTIDTNNINEGNNNLYFTAERVDDRVATLLQAGSNVSLTYDDNLNRLTISSTGNVRSVNGLSGDLTLTTTNISEGINQYYTLGRFDASFTTKSTSNLVEGTNLYFTDSRVRSTVLTGYSGGANLALVGTDTVLQAFGKLQTQIGANLVTFNSHASRTDNPHNVTKAQIGLDNVPNINATVASNISTGLLSDARLSANVTLKGNSFNAPSQLVLLTSDGKLPVVDGSLLTGLISQIANLSDVQLTGLQPGQTLAYNGTKWVNSSVTATVRHDYQGVYSYVGRAPQLNPEGNAVWKITRIQVLTDGNVLTTSANNVTWTGRLTHSYS